jgi:hypothetical protein
VSNTIDEEFEKIVLNEQIRVINRELGRAIGSASPHDQDPQLPFEKFLKPRRESLPDIDMNYEDPWRSFTTG